MTDRKGKVSLGAHGEVSAAHDNGATAATLLPSASRAPIGNPGMLAVVARGSGLAVWMKGE